MAKNEPISYIKKFIKLYKKENHKQVYKICKIVKFKK